MRHLNDVSKTLIELGKDFKTKRELQLFWFFYFILKCANCTLSYYQSSSGSLCHNTLFLFWISLFAKLKISEM